ncbi:MAG: hypothetical protein WCR97_03970 [Bacilli bacterium]
MKSFGDIGFKNCKFSFPNQKMVSEKLQVFVLNYYKKWLRDVPFTRKGGFTVFPDKNVFQFYFCYIGNFKDTCSIMCFVDDVNFFVNKNGDIKI